MAVEVEEDDSEDHPSMELEGDLLEEWFDMDNKWIEEVGVGLPNLLLLLPENLRGALEVEPEDTILVLLEPMLLVTELEEDLEDEVLADSSNEEPLTDELLLAERETEEDDFVGGVENLVKLHESSEPDCSGTIKLCPATIKLPLFQFFI